MPPEDVLEAADRPDAGDAPDTGDAPDAAGKAAADDGPAADDELDGGDGPDAAGKPAADAAVSPADRPGPEPENGDDTGRSHGTVRDNAGGKRRLPVGWALAGTVSSLQLRRRWRQAAARGARLARRWWWLPGWAFAAVTQLPALLAIAWLVPGTGMLLAGRLLPLPMVIIFVPLTVALCYFAMRQLPVSWPRLRGLRDGWPGQAVQAAAPARRRGDMPAGALLATVAIAAGFGSWQAVLRSQQLFTVSDPSVYLQYGYWIAGHGTARIAASASSFGGAPGLVFASPGFHVTHGSLTAAYMPGLPLVLAAGTWLSGVSGALLMPAVLGGCAVLTFGGLVGRLAGPWWAPAGALVLAGSLPEAYVSRTPFSEPLVQVLLFGGLCLFIDSLVVRQRINGTVRGYGISGGGVALAGLGGLALGLTVLASIGSLGMLLPAFPVLALLFVARRPQAGPFGTGLFLGIGIGLVAGLVLARSYLSTLSSELHLFGVCATGFGVLTALLAPLAFPAARSRVRRAFLERARMPWPGGKRIALPALGTVLQLAAVAVPLLVLIGLAIRPYYQTVRGQVHPAVLREVAALQRIAGLPVNGQRLYYEQSLDWVLWYLGIPAVLLGFAGAAVLGRRCVRATLERRLSLPAARAWGLPLLIIGWSVVTVLWDPSVAPWQPWASHRLVPVVLPGLVLLAVWASARLTARSVTLGAARATSALVAFCCLLALAIPPLVTTFNPGLTAHVSVGQYSSGLSKLISRVQLRGVGAAATYRGSVPAETALCTAIGPGASVVFVNADTAAEFEPVVRDMCGQPAATVAAGATSAAVEQIVTSIERTGRHPVLLGPSRSSVALFGVVPKKVISLHTTGEARVLTGPPAGTWPVQYTLWMSSPLR